MISDPMETEAVSLAYDVIETNDVQTEANPIILIHGLFWNRFMFKELGYSLCKETKRKVFTIDLRNHHQSPSCKRCDSLVMTEDVKKFMQDHNLQKVVFVCHSFSSTIAYLIALEKPESVEKIVMIDHAPFADFSEKIMRENVTPQFNGQNRFLRTLDPTLSLMEAKKKILSLATRVTKGQECFLRKVAYDLIKEGNKFKWKTDIQFLMDRYAERAFIVKPKGSINHEFLVVRCKDSGRVSDSKFKDIQRHNPNAKLVTMEDTTHLLMFEKMEAFVDIVKDFLNS